MRAEAALKLKARWKLSEKQTSLNICAIITGTSRLNTAWYSPTGQQTLTSQDKIAHFYA